MRGQSISPFKIAAFPFLTFNSLGLSITFLKAVPSAIAYTANATLAGVEGAATLYADPPRNVRASLPCCALKLRVLELRAAMGVARSLCDPLLHSTQTPSSATPFPLLQQFAVEVSLRNVNLNDILKSYFPNLQIPINIVVSRYGVAAPQGPHGERGSQVSNSRNTVRMRPLHAMPRCS